MPRIHQRSQISSIYVNCLDKQSDKQWTQEFTIFVDQLSNNNEMNWYKRILKREGI